ncbi:MAG: ABC transporter permease [Bryobacteraceae bacterium]|jgi:predicted permease
MNRHDLLLRIRGLFLRRRAEQELDEELRFHLEMSARKNAAGGASGEEAARLARVRFGGIDPVKEDCRTVRGTQLVETTLRDIKYALRGFSRSPLFVLTVVGTIALGLGLNTALFTIFNNFVFRPFPVRDPYSLYAFSWADRAGHEHSFSWNEFEEFSKNNPAFSELAASHYFFARSEGRPLLGALVTGNYFQMLGGVAARGRTLVQEDSAAPGREPVIVLSYAAWQSKFGGDPNIIGRKLVLHGYPLLVIGVTKEGFGGLDPTPLDYWAPLTMAPLLEGEPGRFFKDSSDILVVGRLKRGTNVSQAEAALTGFARQVTGDRRESEKATSVFLQSRATAIRLSPRVIAMFSPLGIAVGLVLLLACANVANMMLARAMARQREIGIRLSLGAGRGRLIRQLLTESLLLAIPAGLAGFLVSRVAIEAGLRIMYATLPPDMALIVPRISLPQDIRVFGFMLVAAFASALLFGLAPAVQSTRADVMLAARGEFTSDARPMRLRNTLVIVQITVCALLLICSGVLIRGESAMRSFDVGFRTHGVIGMDLPEKARPVILQRLGSDSTVEAIAAARSIPLNGILPPVLISAGVGAKTLDAWYNYVSPEFFVLLDIPILEGRNFTADEARTGGPVAIISQLAARRLWPQGSALGREVFIRHDDRRSWGSELPRHPALRVVGVTRNIISCSIPYGPDPPLIYFPATTADHSVLIRVNGNVENARLRLDKELSALAGEDIQDIHSMDQAFALSVYMFRVGSWVGMLLGGLALALTLSGIYGVLSYLVIQRTKEIGIRMALGASVGGVTRLVMMQSMRLAAVGLGLGTIMALGVSRFLASHLVFVNTFDLWAYGAGVVLVVGAALGAAYFPSRRAARIDPLTTLRYD